MMSLPVLSLDTGEQPTYSSSLNHLSFSLFLCCVWTSGLFSTVSCLCAVSNPIFALMMLCTWLLCSVVTVCHTKALYLLQSNLLNNKMSTFTKHEFIRDVRVEFIQ